jgi:hypothetical protein
VARRTPDGIDDRGDAQAASIAAGYFIIELCASDRRVNTLYGVWRPTRIRLNEQKERGRLGAERGEWKSLEHLQRFVDKLKQQEAHELEVFQQFVSDELKLPYTWVAPALLDAFSIRLHNEQHPDDERQFGIPVPVAPDTPKGRAPKHKGEDLKMWIRWFYRAEVQQPTDSKRSIEREYRSWANRNTDSYSVVTEAIEHVRDWFDLLEQRYIVRKPGYQVLRDPDAK